MIRKGLPKPLHSALSKFKEHTLHVSSPSTSAATTTAAAATPILSTSVHPKTLPIDERSAGMHDDRTETLADVDGFACENFRSLYNTTELFQDLLFDSPRVHADLSSDAIRASERFFVSPRTTSSLIEEARLSACLTSPLSSMGPACMAGSPVEEITWPSAASLASDTLPVEIPGDGVPVVTFSMDPYDDFLRSMQDMADAWHVEPRQTLDWDFMEELLFCYLALNHRTVHEYILSAFVDLVVSFQRRASKGRDRRKKVREREKAV